MNSVQSIQIRAEAFMRQQNDFIVFDGSEQRAQLVFRCPQPWRNVSCRDPPSHVMIILRVIVKRGGQRPMAGVPVEFWLNKSVLPEAQNMAAEGVEMIVFWGILRAESFSLLGATNRVCRPACFHNYRKGFIAGDGARQQCEADRVRLSRQHRANDLRAVIPKRLLAWTNLTGFSVRDLAMRRNVPWSWAHKQARLAECAGYRRHP